MKGSGLEELRSGMEEGFRSGLMGQGTKDIGRTIELMEEAD
jgi:hypothetical protein